MKESLCWKCNKTCGGCSWTRNFKPVDGWVATKRIFRYKDGKVIKSYCVNSCPEFEAFRQIIARDCKAETNALFQKYKDYLSEKDKVILLAYLIETNKSAASKIGISERQFCRRVALIKKRLENMEHLDLMFLGEQE